MSEKKHKNCWCYIKINALKYALEEDIEQSKKDIKAQEEIKALLKKTLDNFPDN